MGSADDTLRPNVVVGEAETLAAVGGLQRAPGVLHRGDMLGRYVVLERVGAGGMGVVYAAYDPELDRKLAIKLLHALPSDNEDTQGRVRLLAEARAMAKLAHPNVVTVFDAATHDGRVFLVLEFVDGQTLRSWLAERQRDWREILSVFVDAGRGLAAAHQQSIIHRDFKPDNVMISADGRVRVMDFGIARNESTPLPATDGLGIDVPDTADLRLTKTGALMGTPAYMGPEQFAGTPTDARTDQFSYCVALFEALHGERPFEGDNLGSIAKAVCEGRRRKLEGSHDVPSFLRAALDRGLSVEPKERFESMDALLQELGKDPARTRRRWLLTAGVVAVSVGSAVGITELLREDEMCVGLDSGLLERWNDDKRAEIGGKFEASGASFQAEARARAETLLDAYAHQWTEMQVRGCEAENVTGKMPTALRERQTVCLNTRLVEFGAMVDVLAEADRGTVEHAVDAVQGLLPLEPCANADFLMSVVPQPADPEVARRVRDARDALARARALELASKYDQASQTVDAIAKEVADLDHGPLVSEVALRRGTLLDYGGDYPAALEALETAYFAALSSSSHAQATESAAKIVHVLGDHLERHEEALTWGRQGEALTAMAKLGPVYQSMILNNVGNVLLELDRKDEALAHLKEALHLRETAHGKDDAIVGVTLGNLGRTYEAMGDLDQAIQAQLRTLEIRERALGPEHPHTGDSHRDLGLTYHRSKDYVSAAREIRASIGICATALGSDHPECAWAKVVLARTLRELGEVNEARELVSGALGTLESAHGPEHGQVQKARTLLGALAPAPDTDTGELPPPPG